MVSPLDNSIEARDPTPAASVTPGASKDDWVTYVDSEQAFRLIDSILPFEACLYHQILPLTLEGSRLKLGMVNLDDSNALDYVRRILAYMNCSLVPQALPSDIHYAALTAYLNHTGSSQKSSPRSASESLAQRISHKLNQSSQSVERSAATPLSHQDAGVVSDGAEFDVPSPPAEPGRLVEPAGASDFLRNELPLAEPDPVDAALLELPAPLEAPPPVAPPPKLHFSPTPVEERVLAETLILDEDEASPPEVPPSLESLLPQLQVQAEHLTDAVEVLATLPAADLLQELLGRVLVGGIGRLYFERQPQYGRILWSQNGVLQSVLDELPIECFQAVLQELKAMMHLPATTAQQPLQAEIERLYQRQRLLLRLRIMPASHGEEATLQVLRGAALKFYQQQQLASLSRDALSIAQQLQQKVGEIRSRSRMSAMALPDHMSVLPELNRVLQSVEQQLEALQALNGMLD